MSEPFIGEIRLFSNNYAPQGWAFCQGQLLPINQNQALFSILGTTYGGNGQTTFALPDLRGRVAIHMGNGYPLGQSSGQETHVLTTAELPPHTHLVSGSTEPPNAPSPAGNVWATRTDSQYSTSPNTTLNPAAMSAAGSSQAHPNMQPYLTVNYCIALVGLYPSRN